MQVHNLVDSFNYAIEGVIHTLKTQRNMKIHFSLASIVLISSLFLDITKLELTVLFFAIVFVIAMEMVNTAIEIVVDMISEQYQYRAKIAKNIAAGAVFMAAINSIIVGYLVFFDRLRSLTLSVIQQIKQQPAHLTFINLGLLFIIVITLKANGRRGTPLEGGMPSGHSAIACSVATIIIFLTGDVLITTLVILLALLVIQSRVQSRTHTLLEVVTGGLIGILLTTVIFQLL